MSGTGKYTKYTPVENTQLGSDLSKFVLLDKIFKKGPLVGFAGKEADYRALVVADAKALMQPDLQTGDTDHFPVGVNLDFSGDNLPSGGPDVSSVKWVNPGDPANPYVPDITSPGPDNTAGTDKNVDPEIVPEDIKPTYLYPGAPKSATAGTVDPEDTGAKIDKASELGKTGILGDSGANV